MRIISCSKDKAPVFKGRNGNILIRKCLKSGKGADLLTLFILRITLVIVFSSRQPKAERLKMLKVYNNNNTNDNNRQRTIFFLLRRTVESLSVPSPVAITFKKEKKKSWGTCPTPPVRRRNKERSRSRSCKMLTYGIKDWQTKKINTEWSEKPKKNKNMNKKETYLVHGVC